MPRGKRHTEAGTVLKSGSPPPAVRTLTLEGGKRSPAGMVVGPRPASQAPPRWPAPRLRPRFRSAEHVLLGREEAFPVCRAVPAMLLGLGGLAHFLWWKEVFACSS